MFMFLLVSLWT